MATQVERAIAVVEALAGETLPPADLRGIVEEYLNAVGTNASNAVVAQEFLRRLRRHVVATVDRNARKRKTLELRATIKQAGSNATSTLPAGMID